MTIVNVVYTFSVAANVPQANTYMKLGVTHTHTHTHTHSHTQCTKHMHTMSCLNVIVLSFEHCDCVIKAADTTVQTCNTIHTIYVHAHALLL